MAEIIAPKGFKPREADEVDAFSEEMSKFISSALERVGKEHTSNAKRAAKSAQEAQKIANEAKDAALSMSKGFNADGLKSAVEGSAKAIADNTSKQAQVIDRLSSVVRGIADANTSQMAAIAAVLEDNAKSNAAMVKSARQTEKTMLGLQKSLNSLISSKNRGEMNLEVERDPITQRIQNIKTRSN